MRRHENMHVGMRKHNIVRWRGPAVLCVRVSASTSNSGPPITFVGGLGIITALTLPTSEGLRTEIRKCRSLTKQPFGVNLTLLPVGRKPDYDAYARVIIEEGRIASIRKARAKTGQYWWFHEPVSVCICNLRGQSDTGHCRYQDRRNCWPEPNKMDKIVQVAQHPRHSQMRGYQTCAHGTEGWGRCFEH